MTDKPIKREFAFSRVAGASPGEYAAVSTTAVLALVLSLLGWVGLVWLWGLAVPLVAVLLALLALYYIATSAGTLTGRKVAWSAVVVSLLAGGAGGISQSLDYRQRQAELAAVRGLAARACRDVAAGDYEAVYRQLDGEYRAGVPMGYWRYEWTRFFDLRGRVRKVELSPRTMFLPTGEILLTMRVHVDDPEASAQAGEPFVRVVPIRLVYGRAGATPGQPAEAPSRSAPLEAGWRLTGLPQFISPLPPRYVEPLVWPAPGKVRRAWQGPSGRISTQDVPSNAPPATQSDAPGQTYLGEIALPPLVPPEMFYERWLPVPPPRPTPEHRH